MKRLYFVILVIVLSWKASAQQTTFSKVYVSKLFNSGIYGYSMAPMPNGGYLIVGNLNQEDGFILKSDLAGNALWNRVISKNSHPEYFNYMRFNSVISTFDSAAFIVGEGYSYTLSKELGLVLKVDNAGNIVWANTFEDSHSLILNAACQTTDSGFMVTGYSYHYQSSSNYHPFVARLSKEGHLLWSKRFESNTEFLGSSVKKINDTSYLVTGYSQDNQASFLLKLSDNGDIYWAKKYYLGSSQSCIFDDVIIKNNGFILKSNLYKYASLIKIDMNGNVIWSKSYMIWGHVLNLEANNSLHQTADSGYVFVIGDLFEAGYLYKTDSVGNLLFYRKLILSAEDVIETANGEYFVMGYGPIYPVKKREYYEGEIGFIQFDSLGNNDGNCFFYSPEFDTSFSLLTGPLNFTPSSNSTLAAFDAKTDTLPLLSRSGCVDMLEAINENTSNVVLNVYPNPSKGIFTLESVSGNTGKIVIYNSLGVPVLSLLVINKKTTVNLSGRQSGVYFYKFIDKYGKTAKGKLMLQ